MELVYVSALELCLRTKMIFEHFYVVSRHPFHLIKALIRIEWELFSHLRQLSRLFKQHELKGFVFVGKQFFVMFP